MASNWYLINKPTYNSGFEGEEFNSYKNDGLEEILGEDSPISSAVSLINADLSEIINFRAVVQNNTSDSKNSTTERQIITNIGTLKCGDYILYDGNVYLVISFVGNNTIYEKAIMQLCTYTLKFQSQDGTILSYPCIDETSYQSGVEEGKIISTGNSIHKIKLPFDDNTKLIKVDRRFYVDKVGEATYKITKVNNTEFNYGDKGLIELTLDQTSENYPDDRPDLGICNYFEPDTTAPPVEDETYAKIVCSNPANEITLGGSTRTLAPTFYNADASINNDVIADWNVIYPVGYESKFVITYVGNQLKVKALEDYSMIGKTIEFDVADANGNYKGNIVLSVTM